MALREKTMMEHDTNNVFTRTLFWADARLIILVRSLILFVQQWKTITEIDFGPTLLKRHLKNAAYIDADDIVAIGSNMYRVPSENADTKSVSYIANCELGICTCPSAAWESSANIRLQSGGTLAVSCHHFHHFPAVKCCSWLRGC